MPQVLEAVSSRSRVTITGAFANNVVGTLVNEAISLHNQRLFEVFCFSLQPIPQMSLQDLPRVEHMLDASKISWECMPLQSIFFLLLTTAALASEIDEKRIDMLINLDGWTSGSKNEVFAMKPAPLQV